MSAPSYGAWPGLRYFGERWPSPMFEDADECDTPEGECIWCLEPFEEGESGVLYCNGPAEHIECFLRGVVGGVNHQLGLCTCCGGNREPDPPGMSERDAARAAVLLFLNKGEG